MIEFCVSYCIMSVVFCYILYSVTGAQQGNNAMSFVIVAFGWPLIYLVLLISEVMDHLSFMIMTWKHKVEFYPAHHKGTSPL